MSEPITINQGRPQSKYFTLAYPGKINFEMDQEFICINPKTKSETRARYHGYFRYLWSEMPDSFCLLHYGIPTHKLKSALENAFPEFRSCIKITFLLLEDMNNDDEIKLLKERVQELTAQVKYWSNRVSELTK